MNRCFAQGLLSLSVLFGLALLPLFAPLVAPAQAAQTSVREKTDQIWYRVHLGTGVGTAAVSPEKVIAFVDTEVTPAFPVGFTVIQAHGQWESPQNGRVTRERVVVIEIYCDNTPENRTKIANLAADFVQRFHKAKASTFVVEVPLNSSKLFY